MKKAFLKKLQKQDQNLWKLKLLLKKQKQTTNYKKL